MLGCDIIHTSRTQGTVALSSGETELYATGQGINKSVRSLILAAEFARCVHVIVHTNSTAGKSIASRFGTGKRTKHRVEISVHAESHFARIAQVTGLEMVHAKTEPIWFLLNPHPLHRLIQVSGDLLIHLVICCC